jgi:hypothetical protein
MDVGVGDVDKKCGKINSNHTQWDNFHRSVGGNLSAGMSGKP